MEGQLPSPNSQDQLINMQSFSLPFLCARLTAVQDELARKACCQDIEELTGRQMLRGCFDG